MMGDPTRLGLRLFELEIGLSENVEDAKSAELVDYEVSRIAGQAARLAMVVRGQDIIEDEQTLKKLVAHGLGISPADYREAKRWLMDIDLIQEAETRTGKRILIEKVERLNHSENYRRIGIQWSTAKQRTPKEKALIYTLDRVVEHPSSIGDLDALGVAPYGFLDSGLTVFASTLPRPARRGHVAPGRGFDSGTFPASTARCTSA